MSVNRWSQRGYNLVEVLVAMAILSVVLLSIMTLFVMGRRNVYSGKQMSQANAVGRDVLEDLSSLTLSDVRAAFGIADNAALGNVDVDATRTMPEDTYTSAILRTTDTISAATDPRGYLQSWLDTIEDNEKMANPQLALVFIPRNPSAGAITAGNATVMQVRVLVRWDEGGRRRQAIFDTTKVQRP